MRSSRSTFKAFRFAGITTLLLAIAVLAIFIFAGNNQARVEATKTEAAQENTAIQSDYGREIPESITLESDDGPILITVSSELQKHYYIDLRKVSLTYSRFYFDTNSQKAKQFGLDEKGLVRVVYYSKGKIANTAIAGISSSREWGTSRSAQLYVPCDHIVFDWTPRQ